MKLCTRITEFNYPFSFTDEMIKGPFRKMIHRHIFTKHKNFTEMIDDFYFEAPFGLLGKLVSGLILAPYLQRFLKLRNNFIKPIAEKKNL